MSATPQTSVPVTECDHGHLVQFYEHDAELIGSIGPYLADGLRGGAATIVIATPAHARGFLERMSGTGVDVAAMVSEGSLLVLDAAQTLAALMVEGAVDPAAFDRVIGDLLRGSAGAGRELRAYGEMVALLWEEGNVSAAIELETLWNGLAAELPFTLVCAYRSTMVDGPDSRLALTEMCALHSDVMHPADGELPPLPGLLWAEFDCNRSSPARARRLVEGVLSEQGHGQALILDAVIVVGELASNAVRHARSGFTLSVRPLVDGLRVETRDFSLGDRSAAELVPHAPHGLAIVAAASSRWGSEAALGGKLVWAELAGQR
jgi:hypothetical protein